MSTDDPMEKELYDDSDLFQSIETLPEPVQEVIERYSAQHDEVDYLLCKAFLEELEPLGYTFDYGLDGVPVDLREIPDVSEQPATEVDAFPDDDDDEPEPGPR
ncbi:hypothetical protein AWH63_10940 [Marinobacter sp. C18]|uniref:hypothetical protein n=1 Tax=Marinobacter sp. C18 TaxID=1772288 RepID=UPI0009491CF7|nr:hypothetical protein [Marinobacter sp. C18]OLF82047.1 hypothetical protein AWH63_10940 [Marinobacter sp. C18]